MFEGSQHHDSGFFQPLQAAGASLNGSTNADRTNYWEVVPASALELALWMESDRMGYLLPALTEQKFVNQRDVVLNERRQNYENRPYGLASMAMLAALFPGDHPYHWTTIGEIADLKPAKVDEAHEFFRRYYHPANASIALAGDFDATSALALVRAYFECIVPGPAVEKVARTASLAERPADLPRRSHRASAPVPRVADACDVRRRGRRTRSGDGSARATARRRACTGASCTTSGSPPTSPRRKARARCRASCRCPATAAPGHTLLELHDAILDEVAKLADEGPTDDGDRAWPRAGRNAVHAAAADRRRLRRQVGPAQRLQHVFSGGPITSPKISSRYERVTHASLQQTVKRFLVRRPAGDDERRAARPARPRDR